MARAVASPKAASGGAPGLGGGTSGGARIAAPKALSGVGRGVPSPAD